MRVLMGAHHTLIQSLCHCCTDTYTSLRNRARMFKTSFKQPQTKPVITTRTDRELDTLHDCYWTAIHTFQSVLHSARAHKTYDKHNCSAGASIASAPFQMTLPLIKVAQRSGDSIKCGGLRADARGLEEPTIYRSLEAPAHCECHHEAQEYVGPRPCRLGRQQHCW